MRKKLDDKPQDSFINRWSAKKSQLDNPPSVVEGIDGQDEQVYEEQTHSEATENEDVLNQQLDNHSEDDQPDLTDEDMPDIESLDDKSDFSGFMSPGVSDELRRLALRKLFRSKIFNVRDGLDDYDDDFRNYAALGDIITSDMKHQIELAQERKKEKQRLLEERNQQEKLAKAEKEKAQQQTESEDEHEFASSEPTPDAQHCEEIECLDDSDENEFITGQPKNDGAKRS